MSDTANDWVGQTLSGGRYRVDAKLGEGGMGFVYKVWDRNLDADVVVKAPRKAMLDDPEFASRFALEIRSLVKLSHPNIVKVSDVGEHDGVPFAVMQYLAGGTLDERQDYGRNGRPLPAPPASVTTWLPGMAAALDFIHGKGYIHRDVKPANILFDAHGHPYLSDFGVAKVLSDVEASARKGPSGMTGVGIVLGTPEYMAPELIMGNQFDGKVDQYALAATVYEILCGRKPFLGETATAILVRQTTQEPPPLVELPALGSQAITKVVLKGLAKKPGDRFSNCVEFANALADAALARPVAARPAGDRLACPWCGHGVASPVELANFKGKKSRCRACSAPFRIAQDGLSLARIDPDDYPSPSGAVELPTAADRPPAPARVERTMKLDAIPAPARLDRTMKLEALPGPTRSSGTMKLEAMPGPSREIGLAPAPRANRTMKMGAMPGPTSGPAEIPAFLDVEPARRSPLPWAIGGVAAFAVASMLLWIVVMMRAKPVEDDSRSSLASDIAPPKARPREEVAPTPGPGMPARTPAAGADLPAPAPAPKVEPPPPPAFEPPLSPPAARENRPPADRPPDEVRSVGEPPAVGEDPPVPERHDDAPRSGPSKGVAFTLKQLVSDPADHLNSVESPSDLVLVNTNLAGGFGLSVRSSEGAYHKFQKDGTRFEIVLKPGLANSLRDELNRGVIIGAEYPAILKMRIEKAPGSNGYRGAVEWLELLYYVDARFLEGAAHLNKSMFALILTENGPQQGLTRSYKAWEHRLQHTHIIPTVRNTFIKEGRPLEAYRALAAKAARPDRSAAFFFHNWIKGHVHYKE